MNSGSLPPERAKTKTASLEGEDARAPGRAGRQAGGGAQHPAAGAAWRRFFLAGWRALRRDWRAGELRFLLLALVVAAAAVASIGFLADRVQQAFAGQSAQMIGGDLVLQSGGAVAPAVVQAARERGLEVTHGAQLSSMASNEQAIRLVSLKVVDDAYPLRGSLLIRDQAHPDGRSAGAPPAGEVWVDAQLASLLKVRDGDTLHLGESGLRVGGVILQEPDRGVQFINMAPRVMMNRQDLPATGLAGPLSRVHHTLAVAGEAAAVRGYHDWLTGQLQAGQSIMLPGQARPEIQRSLQRAHQFLVLVALLAVVLAAVAVALAARQFHRRHEAGFAVMRSLGASRWQLGGMLLVEFLLFGLFCAALGVGAGFVLQEALAAGVARWFDVDLPGASWTPAGQGLAACWLLLLGFAMPSLLRLLRAAPMQVLRQNAGGGAWRRWPGVMSGFAAFACLAWWVSGSWRLSLLVCLAFTLWLGVFMAVAYGAVRLGPLLAKAAPGRGVLRWVLISLGRRRGLAAVQVGALSIGLMILLLLMLIRTDLLTGWRNALPENVPNTFLLNVQQDQRQALQQWLDGHALHAQPLVPMVRGRLVAVNGEAAESRQYSGTRARRMVEREFNLSHQERLPDSNRITAGRWLDPAANEVSLENELAETLDIALGDTLTFDVAGETVDVRVTSLREVKWDSFDVNFFALMSPVVLASAPASYITAFHLDGARGELGRELLARFPNLTIVDVGVMLEQVRRIVHQGTQAVQLLFIFTVAAGLLVLGVTFVATREERRHEVALMRALGAQGRQLRHMLYIEMVALGVLSGLLAAVGAMALAALLAWQVFDFPPAFSAWPLLVGCLGGVAAAFLSGGLTLHGVLRASPMRVLREAA